MLRPGYRWSMFRLVLFAISIDDVRDIFRADDSLAERLRAVAAARFAAPSTARRGWFKPLLRRDPDTEVRADHPLRPDVDALLRGGYISPDRAPHCWSLVTAWLEELAAAHREVPWEPESFDRIEWDLAACGLNSDYSLRRLAERQLQVPLRPLPGQVVGYAKHVHVSDTASALAEAVANPELSQESRAFVGPITEVLGVAVERGVDVVIVGRMEP